jgi:hypothetical protein
MMSGSQYLGRSYLRFAGVVTQSCDAVIPSSVRAKVYQYPVVLGNSACRIHPDASEMLTRP